MKICVITDTHYGVRGDSNTFFQYFNKFYDKVFFPYIEKHGIKTVYHLGDLVDRRKYINYQTLNNMKSGFLDRLVGKEVHILTGNHDLFHKNTNYINSLSELVAPYGFHIYTRPTEVNNHLFLPWINQENMQESINAIQNTRCHVAFGHLEIKGFEMMRGNVSEQGLDKNLFSKFDLVASGHFHQKSSKGNIHYLGAPYEMMWSDYAETRGFHIYDTNTSKLTYIKNPNRIFHKIEYDDSSCSMEDLTERDFSVYSGTYVKIIVRKKNNPYWFDLFFDALEAVNPADIRIIEGDQFLDNTQILNFDPKVSDTLTILTDYTKMLGLDKKQHNDLDKLLKKIYDQALTLRDNI